MLSRQNMETVIYNIGFKIAILTYQLEATALWNSYNKEVMSIRRKKRLRWFLWHVTDDAQLLIKLTLADMKRLKSFC